MDDGLTSVSSANNRYSGFTEGLHRETSSSKFYHTFIGTGIGRHVPSLNSAETWAQNLPYGTHILSMIMDSASTSDWFLDGVQIYDNSGGSSVYHNIGSELHIHQPKMPPIPEDAVVISDYMLMADTVFDATGNGEKVSKGVLLKSASRDVLYDLGNHGSGSVDVNYVPFGSSYGLTSAASQQLSYFGTSVGWRTYSGGADTFSETINSTSLTVSSEFGSAHNSRKNITGLSLGVNAIKNTRSAGLCSVSAIEIATPIHTSSHYQSFETPFLHELVGGDRNMEQTNLVVTPDGKTWDEVTRDVGYIGNECVSLNTDTVTGNGTSVIVKFDEIRGTRAGGKGEYFNKDFVMAYDRLICLKDGFYNVSAISYFSSNIHTYIFLNDNNLITSYGTSNNAFSFDLSIQRGDWVQLRGGFGKDGFPYNSFSIKRI